ncbi:hypothetical protein NSX52_24135, partial [Salmonella enterica]|nr:hypothetical protein [Salmonella enterica]
QASFRLEVPQPGRDAFAPVQNARMTPGMMPSQPILGPRVTSNHCHAEKVVRATAVQANNDNLGPTQDRLKVKPLLGTL